MQETDSSLIERVRTSDREAFRLLFEKYQPIVFRYVLHSLQDADSSHDIIQETFLRVWNHRLTLRPELPFLALLFRISRNLVRDHAKYDAVRRKLEADIPRLSATVSNGPEESLRSNILQERLSEAVRTKLPAKCREIFLLSRIEGMSNAEISRHLGISVKTVENQITR
ncbi:MAG: sigma-70 family RNA polymerase sigma factor, partial [Ignavibacteriales bacterium]|nr:sigma-70 family RNA polymerase sigma factor [Ignavibacteriales bacterium]